MAIAAKAPSLLMAIESGWPPRSQVFSIARLARSMTVRLPDGLALLSEVLTAASSLPPATATEVGSPSILTMPAGFGALGSVMSMKPTAPYGLSE